MVIRNIPVSKFNDIDLKPITECPFPGSKNSQVAMVLDEYKDDTCLMEDI